MASTVHGGRMPPRPAAGRSRVLGIAALKCVPGKVGSPPRKRIKMLNGLASTSRSMVLMLT